MPLQYLRPGLPTSSTLTVSQKPCVAKLDQNESPVDLPEELKKDLAEKLTSISWNRYPQPSEYREIRKQFAEALGLDPDTLVLTAGCDQAIQGAHFVAGGPGRKALVFEPTYPMLAHGGLMAGTEVKRVELGPEYEIKAAHFNDKFHLILIASPNNPTGQSLDESIVKSSLESGAYVFLDEAYFDLSQVTFAHLIEKYPNLMIGRSCSKSLLAGMRLGYTICHPEVALRLDQVLTAPYHLSHLQLLIARRFGEILPHVREASDRTIAERKRVEKRLRSMDIKVYPSQTNFLLVKIEKAGEIYEGLADHGVRVRYAPKIPGLEDHLRMTIGTPAQNDLFLHLFEKLIQGT